MDQQIIAGYEAIGVVTSAPDVGGAALTAVGSANTKGSWTELAASTAAEACWIMVLIGGASAGGLRFLVDIGIGAAGSEVVVVPDLHYDSVSSGQPYDSYRIPVAIPAGSRVAVRFQCNVSSGTLRCLAYLGQGDSIGVGTIHAYGPNTADSGLVAVDPGVTAGSDGSWAELTSGTTGDTRWLVIYPAHDGTGGSGFIRWLLDIGIGAAGSETVLISDLALYGNSTSQVGPRSLGFLVDIPAATRITARCRCNSTGGAARLLDVAVWGVDTPDSGGAGGASQHAHASWS